MAASTDSRGFLSLSLGVAAALLPIGFVLLHGGLDPLGPPLLDPYEHWSSLLLYFVVTSLFWWLTPALMATALLFGVRARSTWAGRLGLTLAIASLVVYALVVRNLSSLLQTV